MIFDWAIQCLYTHNKLNSGGYERVLGSPKLIRDKTQIY